MPSHGHGDDLGATGRGARPAHAPLRAGRRRRAVADDEVVGTLHVQPVGTALVAAAIEWARVRGLHKLTLSVFPHNDAAIALYRTFGFVEEGRR
ncbi:MAG TPA: GNAT family N-acetyltransferase [Gaiella sp.]|jgi:GNAT superfamily N-acetyltransferase|nr:GNAT family N-acetyltransferase [Gaiella sp.]